MTNDTRSASARALTVAAEGASELYGGAHPGDDPRATEDFVLFLRHADELEKKGEGPTNLRDWVELAEAWRITQALRSCKGNRSAAARMLGIGRRTLYSKMDKLDITPTWSV